MLLAGLAFGVNLMLAVYIVSHGPALPVALGETVDSGGGYTVAAGKIQGRGDGDAFYIFSHADKKLLIYWENGKMLELMHARDITKDLELKKHGEQSEIEDRRGKDK